MSEVTVNERTERIVIPVAKFLPCSPHRLPGADPGEQEGELDP
jgi:hypothetical protein